MTVDLNLDTDGDDGIDADDDYWNEGAGWAPIGDASQKFNADFQGNGHTIFNLYINRNRQHVGLFGYIGPTGVIGQLYLMDADVSGFWDVGALAGWNAGVIKGSGVSARVSGLYAIGGLVGWNGGRIIASHAVGQVTGSVNNAGGLVAGTQPSSVITSNYARVFMTGGNNVGGMVGEYRGGTINNSYSAGDVQGSSSVGGLVGAVNITTGADGIEWNSDEIVNSYSIGRVSGSDDVGGMIGWNNRGRVTVRDSYWDIEASGVSNSAGGLGKTTMELQNSTVSAGHL